VPAAGGARLGTPPIREVTGTEVEEFWEQGWVRLPELIDPGFVGGMLEEARELMGSTGGENAHRIGFDFETAPAAQSFRSPAQVAPLHKAFAHARQLGRNAARLRGRDVAQRFFDDLLLVKLPLTERPDRGQPLGWHQDMNPTDRSWVYFWVPLDVVEPDQGVVRYLTGSHHLGPLWRGGLCVSIDEAYSLAPRLESCPVSPAFTLRPGDVIAHSSWVVHGTDANTGAQPRWVYRPSMFPFDAEYTGVPSKMISERGIGQHQTLDHGDFPIVYQPGER
jgi:hypothetical protein